MKNKLLRNVIIGLIILFTTIGLSNAGESITFSISCTIPAIPGVNAPLLEETTKPNTTVIAEKETELQKIKPEENKEDMPTMLQEDTQREVLLAGGKTAEVIVKTIYSK